MSTKIYRHGNRNHHKSRSHTIKSELLLEIKTIIKPNNTAQSVWLKSSEVCKLLSISPGTLQNLRISGTIQYSKIGGTLFYKTEDIYKLMEGGN